MIGCHVNGLGVIRSLAMKKFHITAMFYSNFVDFAHTSRYVHERVRIPHPRTEEHEFIDYLLRNAQKWKDALILETNDDIAVALSKNKDRLKKYYRIMTPEWDILRKMVEKPATYRLADDCNVPHPKTFLLKTPEDLRGIQDKISYPCILKPVLGHLFFSEFHSKNFKVFHFGELSSKFELCSKSGHEVMVQEIIPGPDSNIYQCIKYVNSNGKTAATFVSRKLRQNPPQFGVARVAISHDAIPFIVECTESMIRQMDYRGLFTSEFKKDPRDNTFKLMEIIGRTPRYNWLATYCGMNFPWIAYMDLSENKQFEESNYRKNVYWIEFSKDILNSIFHGNEENIGLREYLRPYISRNKTFAELSREDFMHFFRRVAMFLMKSFHSQNLRVPIPKLP